MLTSPARLFLVFAGIFGLSLLMLVPPFGGADEPMHFERTYEVATGNFLGTTEAPAGISLLLERNLAAVDASFTRDIPFDWELIRELHAIALQQNEMTPLPHPERKIMAIHNPLSYLPAAVGFRIGLWLELDPLYLLYLSRLASFLVGISLVWLAIRQLPAHAYRLCMVALLPTSVFQFATLTVDTFTIGLAFLFFAMVTRHCTQPSRPITHRQSAALITVSFLLAQCKSAYLILPLLVILLPREIFISNRHRLTVLFLSMFPGIVISIGWLLLARQEYFDGIDYQTWAGLEVNPDAQIWFILTEPFTYLLVLLRTVFASPWFPDSMIGMTISLGWSRVTLPVLLFVPLFASMVVVLVGEPLRLQTPPTLRQKAVQTSIIVMTITISLTFLYIQWTQLQGEIIKGFQGRYLLPILPLFFCLLPSKVVPLTPQRCGKIIAIMAFVGLGASIVKIIEQYYI